MQVPADLDLADAEAAGGLAHLGNVGVAAARLQLDQRAAGLQPARGLQRGQAVAVAVLIAGLAGGMQLGVDIGRRRRHRRDRCRR